MHGPDLCRNRIRFPSRFHCGTAPSKDPMGPGASSVLRRNAPFRPQLRALDGPEHQSGGRRTRGQRMECVAGRRDQSVRRGGGVRPGRRTADGPGTTDEPHAGLWRSGGRRIRQPPRSRREWAHADQPGLPARRVGTARLAAGSGSAPRPCEIPLARPSAPYSRSPRWSRGCCRTASEPDQHLPTIRQRYIVTVSTKGAS